MGLREVILSPSHPKQNIVLDLVEKGNNFKHFHLLQVLLIFALPISLCNMCFFLLCFIPNQFQTEQKSCLTALERE